MKTFKFIFSILFSQGFLFSSALAADIQPHQAHYNLDIKELNMAGMATSRGGDFFLRIEKTCTSWVLASQFSFNLESEDNIPVSMVMLGQWEETLDGHSMSFKSQTIINGGIVDLYEGVSNNSKDGSEGLLYLTQPTQTTLPLPANTYFPLSATIYSLENIKQGKAVLNYTLYDGAARDAVRVSDLLVGKSVQPKDLPNEVKPYIKGEGWKIITSFFNYDEPDGEATSTHTTDIYENGITTELKISNSQITAVGKLMQFEALPVPDCN